MSVPRCCVCGGTYDVKACPWCGHDFCWECRWGWRGLFRRGKAALAEWLTRNPPRHCPGHEGEDNQ
jgi:hypothetical protein